MALRKITVASSLIYIQQIQMNGNQSQILGKNTARKHLLGVNSINQSNHNQKVAGLVHFNVLSKSPIRASQPCNAMMPKSLIYLSPVSPDLEELLLPN